MGWRWGVVVVSLAAASCSGSASREADAGQEVFKPGDVEPLPSGDGEPVPPPAPDPPPDAGSPPPPGPAPDGGAPPPAQGLGFRVLRKDVEHTVAAVDASGTLLALRVGDRSTLWASRDAGRTWTRRGDHPEHAFHHFAALEDGVLLADTIVDGAHVLARSSDGGVTWRDVLVLGERRMLQPHSIRELDGTVFLAEYFMQDDDGPIHLWASDDGGETWAVRFTFETFRHAHSLLADPATHTLWAFMGDYRGGILRSRDGGFTWSIVRRELQAVVVDGVVTPRGLLFGTDGLYLPAQPWIERLLPDDRLVAVRPLPAPSYSIHALPGGGYLLGTTRETGGDVYPPGEVSARIFGSVDGDAWTELAAFPRLTDTSYCKANVYWHLPTGEALVEVSNAQGFEPSGKGFLVVEARPGR